jgi:hypothetical protein
MATPTCIHTAFTPSLVRDWAVCMGPDLRTNFFRHKHVIDSCTHMQGTCPTNGSTSALWLPISQIRLCSLPLILVLCSPGPSSMLCCTETIDDLLPHITPLMCEPASLGLPQACRLRARRTLTHLVTTRFSRSRPAIARPTHQSSAYSTSSYPPTTCLACTGYARTLRLSAGIQAHVTGRCMRCWRVRA